MPSRYEYRIGLEIHIKLNSVNKLFCKCKNEQEFDNLEPNTNVCPFCMGQPGALPVLNQEPLEKAVLLGLALNCQINEISAFDRKSYFYPDLPAGYQITQLDYPTNGNGSVEFFVNNFEESRKVRIERAHIENDAGKTIHEGGKGFLDYNRAGTPLVEIVTFPDFTSDEEVVEFLKELQRLVRSNNIGYADLEKGQMRVDVNISTRLIGSDKLGTKVEVKNMNSFAAIKRAIEYEFERQIEVIEKGNEVSQETRGRDDNNRSSYTMRSKEDALDYRYFPEPDLPKLKLEKEFIEEIKKSLVEASFGKIKRYKETYNFNKEYINSLIENYETNEYFEDMIKDGISPNLAAKWIVGSLLRFINDQKISINELKFSKDDFSRFLKLIESGKLSDAHAKQVIFEMVESGKSPEKIIEEKGFAPMSCDDLQCFIDEVIKENPKAMEDVKNGEMKGIGFLIGQVVRKSGGKADPKTVKEMIENSIK